MPSKRRIWKGILQEYLKDCEERQLAKCTISSYRDTLTEILILLEEAGLNTHPAKIDKSDCAFVMSNLGHAVSTMKTTHAIFSRFLTFHGNISLKKLGIVFPQDNRPNVDWIEPEELEAVKAVCADPLERFLVHCEGELGMRRIAVMRLDIDSFDTRRRTTRVRGKGRLGGKIRPVKFHENTPRILDEFLNWRQEQIFKAIPQNPNIGSSKELVLTWNKGILKPATKGTMNAVIANVSQRFGKHFTHHTLRRSCGRMMWKSGVQIETIKKFLGHESVDTTIMYLGINLDDLDEAMQMMSQYQKALVCPEEGIFEP